MIFSSFASICPRLLPRSGGLGLGSGATFAIPTKLILNSIGSDDRPRCSAGLWRERGGEKEIRKIRRKKMNAKKDEMRAKKFTVSVRHFVSQRFIRLTRGSRLLEYHYVRASGSGQTES